MGRLRYGMLVSLDGFIEDASGSTDWMVVDEELHGFTSEQDRTVGTRVYGRALWETMRYWQSPPEEDLHAPEIREFAQTWQDTDKVVVSTTLAPPSEPRTELWDHLDLDRLAALVRDSELDVEIGGPTLAAHALEAGLVDELTAYVMPHLAGGGRPWLPPGFTAPLALRRQHTFASGALALVYDVVHEGHATR